MRKLNKTLTVRLPEALASEIECELRRRKLSKSDVLRERLTGLVPRGASSNAAVDSIADLIGSVDGLPPNLSGRMQKYLKSTDYGRAGECIEQRLQKIRSDRRGRRAASPGSQHRCFLERNQIGAVARDLAGHRGCAFGRLGRQDIVVDRRDRGKDFRPRVCGTQRGERAPHVHVLGDQADVVIIVRHCGRRAGDERGDRKASDRDRLGEVTRGDRRAIDGALHTIPLYEADEGDLTRTDGAVFPANEFDLRSNSTCEV